MARVVLVHRRRALTLNILRCSDPSMPMSTTWRSVPEAPPMMRGSGHHERVKKVASEVPVVVLYGIRSGARPPGSRAVPESSKCVVCGFICPGGRQPDEESAGRYVYGG
jgi:hypothetical protein